MNDAKRETYIYQRSTPEFFLYATPPKAGSRERVSIVYIPKDVMIVKFPDCPPREIDLIVGTTEVHNCNCAYCTRRRDP